MDRQLRIGASDVPVLLGLSRWRTPYDLWLEKTGRKAPDPVDNEAVRVGIVLEPALLDWAEQKLGVLRRQVYVELSGTPLGCTLDGLTESGVPVEAKTAGIVSGYSDGFSDDADGIPENYRAQCLAQMAACNSDVCYVPALVVRKGLVMYEINSDSDQRRWIVDRICEWWDKHVFRDVPPDDGRPIPLPVKRDGREIAMLDDSLIDEYIEAKTAYDNIQSEANLAKERLKDVTERIKQSIADYGIGMDGKARFAEIKVVNRKEYSVPASSYVQLKVRY